MTLLHSFGRLLPGTLIKRYKRFLADVRLEDGRVITAFTPNSGSMKTCSDPGSPVMVLHDPKPGRKTKYNLEMVRSGDAWVGVNTGLANTLGAGRPSQRTQDLVSERHYRNSLEDRFPPAEPGRLYVTAMRSLSRIRAFPPVARGFNIPDTPTI